MLGILLHNRCVRVLRLLSVNVCLAWALPALLHQGGVGIRLPNGQLTGETRGPLLTAFHSFSIPCASRT